ncbi:hypothetical protein AC579_9531 [Pseudocercospora musae]|uniref:Uncharacterized protein n=1 Tax=Pseudocercospora musae TaxID=113226 RepID=A0A139I2J8_9PEZI|nr:hypothetical protein AC579_9531 [Pseudocercospora musae]
MPSMSRARFLKEYVLKVDKEFELDSKTAEWAPSSSGGPLEWGQEQSSMEIVKTDKSAERQVSSAAMALSPDNEYLAVASNSAIRIYTAEKKDIRAELIGHQTSVAGIFFVEDISKADTPDGTKYMILSDSKTFRDDGTIIAWYLDSDGKSLTRTMPFAIEALADKCMSAISEDLTSHHELDTDGLAEIRKGFIDTIVKSDMKNRLQSLTHWKGHFPSFGSKPLSTDGERWLQVLNNDSTQSGPRRPALLPTIIVRHFDNINSATYLHGHDDAIMWASFSPTNSELLATASWDGTFRIWSALDGRENLKITQGDVQDWSGDFSPDGRHVLFAGTECVSIYSIDTGDQVLKLAREGLKTESWIRYLSWSPAGDAIALGNGMGVLLWRPFDKKYANWDRVDEILKLGAEEPMHKGYMSFNGIRWLDRKGHLLAAADGENSFFVWDRERNLKWRFQRPMGKELKLFSDDCLYDEKRKVLITLDGDWKLREWNLK